MKNVKISSIVLRPVTYYIKSNVEYRELSKLEDSFFIVIQYAGKRAELQFHMSREWGGIFYDFYMKTGQKLDADTWLTFVDEMDRRRLITRDTSYMKRKKLRMVNILSCIWSLLTPLFIIIQLYFVRNIEDGVSDFGTMRYITTTFVLTLCSIVFFFNPSYS